MNDVDGGKGSVRFEIRRKLQGPQAKERLGQLEEKSLADSFKLCRIQLVSNPEYTAARLAVGSPGTNFLVSSTVA